MKRILIFLMLAVCFCLVNCTKETDTPQVEVIEGVTHVHNTENPRYPGRTVSFLLDLTIGGEEVSGEAALYQPGFFAVDSRGFIFINDREDMTIKVYDPDGGFVHTIGSKGEGPGEFQRIGRLGFLPDGRLIVFDFQARRTSILSAEGDFLKSHKWLTSRNFLLLTTNSSYTTNENIFSEETRVLVKTYDFEGQEILSFGEFSPPQYKSVRQGDIMFGTTVPYSPYSIFAGDQNRQWLYHLMNDKYKIEVYDQEGILFRKIDRPYTPLPVTKKDEDEFRSRADDQRNEVYAKFLREMPLPKVKSISRYIMVDDEGNLWIRTYEEKEVEGRTLSAFDIFDHKGFYVARIWSHFIPVVIAKGEMYRMDTDEENGFHTLKRYRMVWN